MPWVNEMGWESDENKAGTVQRKENQEEKAVYWQGILSMQQSANQHMPMKKTEARERTIRMNCSDSAWTHLHKAHNSAYSLQSQTGKTHNLEALGRVYKKVLPQK